MGTDPLGNRLEPQELAQYLRDANADYKRLNAENNKNETADPKDLVVDDVMSDEHIASTIPHADLSLVEKTAFRCAAGKCTFWVTWEGKMLPCGLLTTLQSDALSLGFENSFVEIKRKCREVPACQTCENCSYYSNCQSCPARLKLESDDFAKPADYLCEYVKARDAVRASQ
jgi:MoaA/NifB/PqqE/SkfB family radical SAM enzyme